MWRGIAIGSCLALLIVAVVSGQGQRSPATLDDLLSEIRGLRADINQGTLMAIQADLLMGRLQLEEQRISWYRVNCSTHGSGGPSRRRR